MAELLGSLKQRFFDDNGDPLAGGKLYSYAAGLSTPLATFTDETEDFNNTNPIILDGNGEADVWVGDAAYKFTLTDAADVPQWTVDHVRGLTAQIAEQINIVGALAAANNLSDLANVPTALVNLGIAPMSYPAAHSITSGQSATNLTAETFNGTVYTSVEFIAEIIQGTTIVAHQYFSLFYINGTWALVLGECRDNGTTHGVTFSITQSTTIAQLKAAESGLGNGTINIKKSYFFA